MDYEPPPAFAGPQDRGEPMAPAPGPGAAAPSLTTTLIAAGAVVAAAVLVIGLVLIFSASNGQQPDRRITLPEAAGGFELIHSIDGTEAQRMLGSQLGSLGPLSQALGSAQVGVYGTSQTALPQIVFLGLNRSDSTAVDEMLRNASAQQVAHDLLGDAGSNLPQSFDPGPFGGTLQCAQASKGGTAYTPCVWVDQSTLALVLRIGDVDAGAAADLARTFRNAAER